MITSSPVGATPRGCPYGGRVSHDGHGERDAWDWKTGGHRGRPYENNTHNKHGGKP